MIDNTDRQILRLLQSDATHSLETIAAKVNVSVNTCWRRVKHLEETKVITGRVAIVDPNAVQLGQTVMVAIRTNNHSAAWLEKFTEKTRAIPEVMEFYRMAGDVDYLLKIVVNTVADYDRVYKIIISDMEISDVSATFAMECIKNTTVLPV
ncbi:Lrp/AsnC family transcriptional regulator [Hirschia litorea]|uniref:Lrp/AsnC family transcriptional regulator n=1 Tax=Hirschia litorea TaxID=1199156 RepID=A0ABW2IH73_9PROT